MKRQLPVVLLLAAAAGYVHAQSDVYLCVDESGKKEYKNTGTTKGCKRIDLPSLSMVPAPAAAKKPAVQTASAKSSSSPSDFPKVDSGTQKARDSDRKQILLDEMKAEEQKLAAMKKEFNDGEPERRGDERNYAKYQERVASMKEDIGRTEKNIEALKREIGNLK
ncbi:DUF4124 domain-containing protein [Noviherbaspirillum cavernae]|uniref:DUF4124 domain-containing protein n=1 Tax=Noviherbaspirillum cavernae TaxID=2320862 RepID=A0A418WZB7_9BURK|nr:DUF4124 domain-containing protein [Noviherbaspirillum cavernae]RJG05588.1 DUF4124 domain-containing protein [Noviherbaspirillum cavernae]